MNTKEQNNIEPALEPFSRILLDMLCMPRVLEQLNQKLAVNTERFTAIETAQRTHGHGLEELGQSLQEQTQALEAFYQKQQCLEEASRQQTLLTQQHFDRHIVEPLARRVFPLLDMLAEGEDEEHSDTCEAMRVELLDLLAGYGVEPISVHEGDPFDAKRMQPAGFADINRKNKDMTVKTIVRSGFRYEDRILRPALVELYRFNNSPQDNTHESEGEDHE